MEFIAISLAMNLVDLLFKSFVELLVSFLLCISGALSCAVFASLQ